MGSGGISVKIVEKQIANAKVSYMYSHWSFTNGWTCSFSEIGKSSFWGFPVRENILNSNSDFHKWPLRRTLEHQLSNMCSMNYIQFFDAQMGNPNTAKRHTTNKLENNAEDIKGNCSFHPEVLWYMHIICCCLWGTQRSSLPDQKMQTQTSKT